MMNADLLSKHFLLVAMPQLQDLTFAQSVIYLSEYDTQNGAQGIIVNKPMQIHLGNILEQLHLEEVKHSDIKDYPVLMGGPIRQDHGFIIYEEEATANKEPGISISTSKVVLEDIVKNKNPEEFLITLGYSGWDAGQLEKEIAHNNWLIVPFDRSILFDTPLKDRWKKAAALIGVNINHLSDQIGHA